MERVCEGCAGEDDDLVLVRRLYPGAGGQEGPGTAPGSETAELWCFSCRSQYPHEVAED